MFIPFWIRRVACVWRSVWIVQSPKPARTSAFRIEPADRPRRSPALLVNTFNHIHHQQMLPAGRHFERALGALLSLDVGKIGQHAVGFGDAGLWSRQNLDAAKVIGDGDEAARRPD